MEQQVVGVLMKKGPFLVEMISRQRLANHLESCQEYREFADLGPAGCEKKYTIE